jgi:hypothetical protein
MLTRVSQRVSGVFFFSDQSLSKLDSRMKYPTLLPPTLLFADAMANGIEKVNFG